MNTSVQLKLNLPAELQSLLKSKASKFGLPLTQYVKHVLVKDVEEEDYPVYQMSERAERHVKEAMDNIDQAVDAGTFLKKLKLNK